MNDHKSAGFEDCGFDLDAWATAYDDIGQDLIRYVAFVVGPGSAEDVVSQTIIKILESKPSPVANIRGYLYRAVGNAAKNHLRTSERRRRLEERSHPEPSGPVSTEGNIEIVTVMKVLTVSERMVLFLIYWVGMSRTEAASWLCVTKGTVNRLHGRAVDKLSDQVSGGPPCSGRNGGVRSS